LNAEVRTGRPIRIATLIMTILATFAIELAIAEPGLSPLRLVPSTAGLMVAPMLLASAWLGRSRMVAKDDSSARRSPHRAKMAEFAAILLLLILPFVEAPICYAWSGRGSTLELVLIASLRNLGLGLAALSHRLVFARLAALVSLFLALIASSMGDGWLVLATVGAYSVVGTAWLMLTY